MSNGRGNELRLQRHAKHTKQHH